MVKLGVNGACGRMGLRIMALACKDNDISLTHAMEHDKHSSFGKDIGSLIGCKELGIKITDKLPEKNNLDVLIDFSSPSATIQRVKECSDNGIGIVIGTTGLSEEQKTEVASAAKKIPCLMAPNMSVGVNLLFDIVAQVANTLGNEFDVEIIETHHRLKKDAPSGTALRIAERICETTNRKMKDDVIYGRHGQVGERKKKQIGIHAVRSGDTVGIHKVIFDSSDECIEITHNAHSRDTFASGALRAAKFIAGRPPGLYNMDDVLKEKK